MATKKPEKQPVPTQEYMQTGCDLLDLLLGGDKGVYGIPFGAILNIIGDKSAGKTFFKNEILAANYWKYRDRLVWHSDDGESGDTFSTERMYGVDLHPLEHRIGAKRIGDSVTVEEMDAKVSLMLEAIDPEQVGIYAIDSLDGLSDATREALEAGRLKKLKQDDEVVDPGDYGAQIAKFMSQQFFRTKHKKLEDARCSVIIVSQIRENMKAGPYSQKWTVSCGKALEFYAHTRVFLKSIAPIKRGDRIVGGYVSAVTKKSKTPRPYREVFYSFYFDYGIDNIGSNIDYLFNLRTKDGELNKDAQAITWSETAREKDLENLGKWLQENGLVEACKDDKKKATGSSALSIKYILEWINVQKGLREKFDADFGVQYTRDQLIAMCEKDRAMRDELTRRVREKWERIEDAVKTDRPSKYAQG